MSEIELSELPRSEFISVARKTSSERGNSARAGKLPVCVERRNEVCSRACGCGRDKSNHYVPISFVSTAAYARNSQCNQKRADLGRIG